MAFKPEPVKLSMFKNEWPSAVLQYFYKLHPYFTANDAQVAIDDTTLNSNVVTGQMTFNVYGMEVVVPFVIRDSKLLPPLVMVLPSEDPESEEPRLVLLTKENFERLLINRATLGIPVSNNFMKQIFNQQSSNTVVDRAQQLQGNPLGQVDRIGLYPEGSEAGKIKIAFVIPTDKNHYAVQIYSNV